MNAHEIAEVIAEYLVNNKNLVIVMIEDNDKETLKDEIYDELTEIWNFKEEYYAKQKSHVWM